MIIVEKLKKGILPVNEEEANLFVSELRSINLEKLTSDNVFENLKKFVDGLDTKKKTNYFLHLLKTMVIRKDEEIYNYKRTLEFTRDKRFINIARILHNFTTNYGSHGGIGSDKPIVELYFKNKNLKLNNKALTLSEDEYDILEIYCFNYCGGDKRFIISKETMPTEEEILELGLDPKKIF